MKIKINKSDIGYNFNIVESKNGSEKVLFSSARDYFLTSFVKSNYKYAWVANSDANDIIDNNAFHFRYRIALEDMDDLVRTDVSAESMLIEHYYEVLDNMDDRIRSSDYKEKDLLKKEISIILDELAAIIEKIDDRNDRRDLEKVKRLFRHLLNTHFGKKIMASAFSSTELFDIDGSLKKEMLIDYAKRACRAIEKRHSSCVYSIDYDNGIIEIKENDGDDLLKVFVNKKFHIDYISPCGYLKISHPLHSCHFYQIYWKPIVESVGHFYVNDHDQIIVAMSELPYISNSDSVHKLESFDVRNKCRGAIELIFRNNIWLFGECNNEFFENRVASNDVNVSKYTEQDYFNAIVKCTDRQLKSLYGRSGSVVQVIPREDVIELDIDFGRGIGIVRLTEDKIGIQKV